LIPLRVRADRTVIEIDLPGKHALVAEVGDERGFGLRSPWR